MPKSRWLIETLYTHTVTEIMKRISTDENRIIKIVIHQIAKYHSQSDTLF